MKRRPLIVITTRLPPSVCGVGAHSWMLARHWPEKNRDLRFLVMEGADASRAGCDLPVIADFNGRPEELLRQLQEAGDADVLLHYAGRAYQRFGCPVWLPGVLARWKKESRGRRLMIFFHEMPGALPMTSRHFWLGKINSWIIRRLAACADVLVSNTENHVAQLRRISGDREVHSLPVGSNIEAVIASSEARAQTEFVIFGLPFGRWQTRQLFESYIPRWIDEKRLTKLHLIGPPDELIRHWPHEGIVVRHGALPTSAVASHLRRATFALTNATEETWSKSGAFMACAANECPVVLHAPRPDTIPLSCAVGADEVSTISVAERANRSATLGRWYREHADWKVIAKRIADLFQETP